MKRAWFLLGIVACLTMIAFAPLEFAQESTEPVLSGEIDGNEASDSADSDERTVLGSQSLDRDPIYQGLLEVISDQGQLHAREDRMVLTTDVPSREACHAAELILKAARVLESSQSVNDSQSHMKRVAQLRVMARDLLVTSSSN